MHLCIISLRVVATKSKCPYICEHNTDLVTNTRCGSSFYATRPLILLQLENAARYTTEQSECFFICL